MFLEDFDDEAYHRLLKKEAHEDGFAEGKTEGTALALLEILESMGEVPGELRKRIAGQSDMETLKKWLRTAAKTHSIEAFRADAQL